jgi:nucleotide-binding universal stress UspA family protein
MYKKILVPLDGSELAKKALDQAEKFDKTFDGLNDIFVVKLDPSGRTILYATLLGGQYEEESTGIVVDADGHAYVTGYTLSPDFQPHHLASTQR